MSFNPDGPAQAYGALRSPQTIPQPNAKEGGAEGERRREARLGLEAREQVFPRCFGIAFLEGEDAETIEGDGSLLAEVGTGPSWKQFGMGKSLFSHLEPLGD